MTKSNIVEVKGKCKWAFVNKTTTNMDGKPIYSIDIRMSEDTFNKLKEEHNLHPRRALKTDKETGETYLVVTKPVTSRKGKELYPPKIMDSNDELFEGEIGNGSTVIVGISMLKYDNQFGKGCTTALNYVKVIDLVEYNKEDNKSVQKPSKIIDSDVDF